GAGGPLSWMTAGCACSAAGWPTTLALAAGSVGTAPLAGLARTTASARPRSEERRRSMTASGRESRRAADATKTAGIIGEPQDGSGGRNYGIQSVPGGGGKCDKKLPEKTGGRMQADISPRFKEIWSAFAGR